MNPIHGTIHRTIPTWTRCTILLGLVAVLAGCGTTAINQMAMEAHHESLLTQRTAIEQHQNACAATAASCRDDMCRVAVTLACSVGQPEMRIEQPRLRSPGEEFARGFGPIASLMQAGLQVYGSVALVDQQGQNMVDLVTATGGVVQQVGQVVGNVQPVDHSITVGGNLGDTEQTTVGGNLGDTDQSTTIGGNLGDTDQSTTIGGNLGDTEHTDIGGNLGDTEHTNVGGNLGDTQQIDITESCIGEACRTASPGPIDESDNSNNSDNSNTDNSDNSDNSTQPPPIPDPAPDPDPGG